MSNNKSMLGHFVSLFIITLFLAPNLRADFVCKDLFNSDNQENIIYVNKTSTQSRIKKLAQTIFTGATLLQIGTPKFLRGIKMKGIFWVRDGQLLSGMKRAYGNGTSPWGAIEVFTSNGNLKELDITISPIVGHAYLSSQVIDKLQKIYPTLKVEKTGNQSSVESSVPGEIIPEKIFLSLKSSEMKNDNKLFEESSRNLMNSLFNDPYGLLGLNPKVPLVLYEVPRVLSNLEFIKENLEFFGNFGEWNNHYEKLWTSYSRIQNSLSTSLRIDLKNRKMFFWLENESNLESLKANVRRVVSAMLVLNHEKSFQGSPNAKVSGINGLQVYGLEFNQNSVDLVKLMNLYQNKSEFNTPIQGLTPEQKDFVSYWIARQFTQDELTSGYVIKLNDIVEKIN